MKIILGSQSKSRKNMMEEMGFQFEIMAADIDEKAIRHDDPEQLTLSIARAKAEVLKPKITEPAILITADTVVVCQEKIREKPVGEKEAREFLISYGSNPAVVVNGVVVTNTATGKSAEGNQTSTIQMSPFSEQDIEEILKDGSLFNWAGGFDVVGELWEKHVLSIDGTRDGIIGLPKDLVKKLIAEVVE